MKRIVLQRTVLLLAVLTGLLFAANIAPAQDQQPPEYLQRLRSPTTVRGTIGGESHHSYVIRARKGQMMTVRLSWRPELGELGDNQAQFYVSELPQFGGDGAVKFGKESDNGNRWTGRIPRTGDYYIYVMAHPIADYTLRVTVR